MAISLTVGWAPILFINSDSCDWDLIKAQSDFWIPVECFLTGGGVVGNLFWSAFFCSLARIALQLGGVVGGVTFRWLLWQSRITREGGLKAMPGEGGGLVLHELKLEAAESTLGMLDFVLGVLGSVAHSVSLFLLVSCLGEADSSLLAIWFLTALLLGLATMLSHDSQYNSKVSPATDGFRTMSLPWIRLSVYLRRFCNALDNLRCSSERWVVVKREFCKSKRFKSDVLSIKAFKLRTWASNNSRDSLLIPTTFNHSSKDGYFAKPLRSPLCKLNFALVANWWL